MIAAPDHLARRGMNPSMRPRERHADAKKLGWARYCIAEATCFALGSAAVEQRHWSRYFTAHDLVWYDCSWSHVRTALQWDVS